MADQSPLKVILDGSSNTCGLGQFAAADTVGVVNGGTGLATQGICAFAQPGINAVACKTTYIGICAGKSEGAADENTYVGYGAGQNVTTGCYHTIIGSNAGDAITTCSSSVLIGYNAGTAITFGDFNTLIGTAAGAAVVTASNNTTVGYHAATATICSNNVAIGACAMVANTQGQDNVAIGLKAGATQVASGCNNVFVGSCVGAVALCRDNTLIGAYAGVAQTTATGNTMAGLCVGYGVVDGAGNVYLGYKAGLVNTSGTCNVFIGNCAGVASTASCCLIIGNGTCDIITGNFNTGNVGIGTATPREALHVVGDVLIHGSADCTDQIVLERVSEDVMQMHFKEGSGTTLYPSMALRYDGTGGGGTGNEMQIYDTSGDVARVTFERGGNVGIGTATPGGKLDIITGATTNSEFHVGEVDNEGAYITSISDHDASLGGGVELVSASWTARSTTASMLRANAGCMFFYADASLTDGSTYTPTSRMVITSGGRVGIGTDSPAIALHVCDGILIGQNTAATTGYDNALFPLTVTYTGSSTQGAAFYDSITDTSSRYAVWFKRYPSSSWATVGSISTTNAATAFNTSSDYRLKENETPITGALDSLNQLKPYEFNFKSDMDEVKKIYQGFFAHEAAEIVPQAITGEKDALDDNGKILPQGIDHSHMVPLLVAAVQELTTKVESLAA